MEVGRVYDVISLSKELVAVDGDRRRAVTFLSGIDTDISGAFVTIRPSMLMYTTLVKLTVSLT